MRTCETCRWWLNTDLICTDEGRCDNSVVFDAVMIDLVGTGTATLWFEKSFGCVHHEEKNNES